MCRHSGTQMCVCVCGPWHEMTIAEAIFNSEHAHRLRLFYAPICLCLLTYLTNILQSVTCIITSSYCFIGQEEYTRKMDNLRKEEVIQAVLIADSYNDNFQPIIKDGNTVNWTEQMDTN